MKSACDVLTDRTWEISSVRIVFASRSTTEKSGLCFVTYVVQFSRIRFSHEMFFNAMYVFLFTYRVPSCLSSMAAGVFFSDTFVVRFDSASDFMLYMYTVFSVADCFRIRNVRSLIFMNLRAK